MKTAKQLFDELQPASFGRTHRKIITPEQFEVILDAVRREESAPLGLRPIETAPKDGTYILLFGPSGYITTPLRCEVCRYDPEYRPRQPWVTHANDSFLDGGEAPTHWAPLPAETNEADSQELLERACISAAKALRAKIHGLATSGEAAHLPGGIFNYTNAKWLDQVSRGDAITIMREIRHETWKQPPHKTLRGTFPVVLYLASEADRAEVVEAFKQAKPDARAYNL